MLDLARLHRLKLVRRPFFQRLIGRLLGVNYGFLPGVEIVLENSDRIPDRPVIYAMNHTDRYNYFPFQYCLWKQFDRFTAAWVKGKYYENRFLAAFMESTAQLPTVSRGYLITRDFLSTMGRTPTDREYALLREVVDACALGDDYQLPKPPEVPEKLLRKARNPMGVAFDPLRAADPAGVGDSIGTDYAQYICELFRAMMARLTELNFEAIGIGLDLLIFPQGTRSRRLLPGRVGIGQIGLKLGIPIVPVGCNGSDRVYPGSSPFGGKGRIVYRFGEPIQDRDLAAFHIAEDFEPFSATAERDHASAFQGVSDLITQRIDALLDPEYRRASDAGTDATHGSGRFV
ncbi:MAG: 1-acyl-sn-glycerol-3-phosphate acyltransferase [Deltaproteobacteria bacterium]|nr:1-acyl-sn-glycerol-3-phosphate acyltransferase [Deltaproteobacteria bacterium]